MEVKTDDATSMETSCGLAYYEMYSNLADSIDGKANLFCPVEEALKAEVIVEAALSLLANDIRSGAGHSNDQFHCLR